MAFCTKCGKELADGEVCSCETANTETAQTEAPKAETPVANEAPKAEAPAAEAPKAEKPAKKKNVGVLAGLIAVVLVVVVVLVAVMTSKPYMKPLKDFMNAINKRNTSELELTQTLMPDFGAKEFGNLYKKMLKMNANDLQDSLEDSIEIYENYYENATDEYGEWKLTFELKKATKLDSDDDEFDNVKDGVEDYYKNNLDSAVDYFEDLLDDEDDLEDWADDRDVTEKEAKTLLEAAIKYYQAYKEIEVSEVYEVKGKFIIKADGEEYDTDTCKLYMVKANGDWFYWSFLEGDLNFDGDDNGYFSFIRSYLRKGKIFSYAF